MLFRYCRGVVGVYFRWKISTSVFKSGCVLTYCEARRLSRNDELDVSRYRVLTDTRLHPDLTEFITGLWQTWRDEYNLEGQHVQSTVSNMSSQLCVCFFLEQCCTYGIDGHSGFIVVHTAQNQIHRLPFLQPSITEKTESFVVKACNPLRREQSN